VTTFYPLTRGRVNLGLRNGMRRLTRILLLSSSVTMLLNLKHKNTRIAESEQTLIKGNLKLCDH